MGLENYSYKEFFANCRKAGLSYDTESQEGLLFLIND